MLISSSSLGPDWRKIRIFLCSLLPWGTKGDGEQRELHQQMLRSAIIIRQGCHRAASVPDDDLG